MTPLYNAGTGAVNLFNNPNGFRANREPPVTNAPVEGRLLGMIGDKKVIYEHFRNPFVLLEEVTHNFAPVYKEYPPNATEMCTYPMLHFGSQEFHCPWLVRHSGPQNLAQPLIPAAMSKPALVPASQKHRVTKTIRTLAQHRAITEQQISNRPRFLLRGMGSAPLPPIAGPVAKASAAAERPRPGFCECCYEKYSNLDKHLHRDTHRRLVCTGDFYRSVDRVLNTLLRPAAKYSHEENNMSQPLNAPPSPAKSVASVFPIRVKSIPLKNITNQIPIPLHLNKPIVHAMDEVDVGSDSPIYSSPSLKRRRSQRLVGRTSSRSAPKFVL